MTDERIPRRHLLSPAELPGLLQAIRDGAVVPQTSCAAWVTGSLPDTAEGLERELAFVEAMWEGGRTHGTLSSEDLGHLEERRAQLRRGMMKLG